MTNCTGNIQNEPSWDASQIKPPGWDHVFAAFVEGAREAKANPEATDDDFKRAADGYTKRVFEEVDPVSEAALRTGSWLAPLLDKHEEAYGSGGDCEKTRADLLAAAWTSPPKKAKLAS